MTAQLLRARSSRLESFQNSYIWITKGNGLSLKRSRCKRDSIKRQLLFDILQLHNLKYNYSIYTQMLQFVVRPMSEVGSARHPAERASVNRTAESAVHL
jgi:hypothetical protein